MPKQFSLRLLLAVVTVVCIALGVWGSRAERQRRAVQAIEAAGGEVSYISRTPEESETLLGRWLPQDYSDDVQEVWFSADGPITDDVLAHLESLPKLRCLLVHNGITDVGVAHLERLKNLEDLGLGGTNVTDAGLAHLQGLTDLRSLDLAGTQVSDAGLVCLRGLPKLDTLWLDCIQVSDAGLAHLQGLTHLQALFLYGTRGKEDRAVRIRKALPNCTVLFP